MKYRCWGCDTTFDRSDDSFFCETCKPLRLAGELKINLNIVSDHPTQEKGYAGYNHGLDTVIKDKAHWKEEMKRQGVRSVG